MTERTMNEFLFENIQIWIVNDWTEPVHFTFYELNSELVHVEIELSQHWNSITPSFYQSPAATSPPASSPPPSSHPPHGREHRTGPTWKPHLGPAGRWRWRTFPPESRSAEALRRRCESGPRGPSPKCRPWSQVTVDALEKQREATRWDII